MTFSISFSKVFKRIIEYNGQWPRLIHVLAILTIFFKHLTSLITALRCFYETLSGLEVDELLHL